MSEYSMRMESGYRSLVIVPFLVLALLPMRAQPVEREHQAFDTVALRSHMRNWM
ncbi:MAG: hypothetical protein JWQ98_2907 [Chlorobi bacterium]|nr:hypothetical protein [Chlorobiota bacterium]